MKNNRGFSLLELLIVVAIILIIATIAIPSLLRSRQAANETAAVAGMRALNTAQLNYSSALGGAYGTLDALIAASLIDSRYSSSNGGYAFVVNLSGDRLDYTAYATATSPNNGRYDYYSTPEYVIRYSTVAARAPDGLAGEPVR